MQQSRIKDDVFSTGYLWRLLLAQQGKLLWEQSEREQDRQSRTNRERERIEKETVRQDMVIIPPAFKHAEHTLTVMNAL